MSGERPYDIVIFGASGFTGQYVLDELARTIEEEGGGKLKWALAGRSFARVIQTLRNACDRTGKDLSRISVVKADVSDAESLSKLASQTKVLLNCVGPYRFFGEPVVKACVEQGTHQLDLSGEPGFLEEMQVKYDSAARESGAVIIGSCGWDTIPTDMAVLYTQRQFSGDLAWIESFLTINRGKKGPMLNFGTFQSGIYNFLNMSKDLKLHNTIMNKALPPPSHTIPWRPSVFYSSSAGGWCMMLPDSEKCVVDRTQKYHYQNNRQRPVQFDSYFRPGSIFSVMFYLFTGAIFGLFSQFKWTRSLLEKFPRLFSGGIFKKGGPKKEQVASSSFSMKMIGRGWTEKLSDPDDKHRDKPSVKVTTRVQGPELAYVTTPICMVQATYTLLAERERTPSSGGVYTPGAVFANTSLLDRLQNRGVLFSVEE